MAVVLLVPAMSLEKRYSNSWAVEVKGGHEVAEQLARKHGFINRGQVHDMHIVHVSERISGCEKGDHECPVRGLALSSRCQSKSCL